MADVRNTTTRVETRTAPPAFWSAPAAAGLVGGFFAAIAMAAYAMAASDTGFFTPLYHIGSAFGTESAAGAMETSMAEASAGDDYHFATGPAALGAAIHLATGAGWGLAFGLGVRAVRASRLAVVVAGVAFGLAVMLAMAHVALPGVAALFGSGAPIRGMAAMVGWDTFTIEHAIYGLVLGLAVAPAAVRRRIGERRPQLSPDAPEPEREDMDQFIG